MLLTLIKNPTKPLLLDPSKSFTVKIADQRYVSYRGYPPLINTDPLVLKLEKDSFTKKESLQSDKPFQTLKNESNLDVTVTNYKNAEVNYNTSDLGNCRMPSICYEGVRKNPEKITFTCSNLLEGTDCEPASDKTEIGAACAFFDHKFDNNGNTEKSYATCGLTSYIYADAIKDKKCISTIKNSSDIIIKGSFTFKNKQYIYDDLNIFILENNTATFISRPIFNQVDCIKNINTNNPLSCPTKTQIHNCIPGDDAVVIVAIGLDPDSNCVPDDNYRLGKMIYTLYFTNDLQTYTQIDTIKTLKAANLQYAEVYSQGGMGIKPQTWKKYGQ
jgi:hypothetical protein